MTRRIRFTPLLRAGVFLGAALGGAGSAGATDVPFTTRPPISTAANGAYSAALADVDGDGDLDALSASIYDDKVAWYENTAGNGTTWVLRTITTAADAAFSVHGADVDGDGDQDVLSASVYDDRIAWYENTAGNGSAWSMRIISVTADGARAVRTADVDGDGDTDVLSASPNDDKIAWYENILGNGTAWALRTISTAADSAWSVAAADVDRDGDQDVLSSSAYDDKIAWYENTAGNGTAWTLRTISTGADGALGLFAADVDGDGDVDALSASISDGELTWYENVADGTSWTAHPIATTPNGPFWIAAADLDADGDQDVLATVVFNTDAVLWFENTAGNGTSWTAHTITTAVNSPVSAVAGDVDGDGDADVVAADLYNNAVAWYRNDTIHQTACFTPRTPISTVPFGPRAAVSGDVDGDGDLDALSASYLDDTIAWYENAAGDATTWNRRTISTSAQVALSVFAGDVDGDGDLDALSASFSDNKVAWYENTAGNGTAWTTRTISTAIPQAADVRVADVDGDGDLDALSVSSATPGLIAWHQNVNGTGTAWNLRTISQAFSRPYRVSPADVDGDGDVDVLTASVDDDAVTWFENVDGTGTVWGFRVISTAGDRPLSVAAADVDGDGDQDVLAASVTDGEVAWHENVAGTGTTWTRRTISTAAAQARAVGAADVDSDGDEDVLVGSAPPSSLTLFENTAGNGSAWTAHTLATQDTEPWTVAAADLDGDGDLDAIAALGMVAQVGRLEARPGQAAFNVADLAPPGAMNGDLVAMLGIVVTHGGRAGDGDLEIARLGLRFEEGPGDPLTSAEANAIIESLRVYRDANGNGLFEPGTDVLVASVPTLALTSGVQVVTFTDGDPNLQVAQGTPRRYFVVTEITATASTQTPNRFRVTHLGLGPSASQAEDRTFDLPLRVACAADVASSVLAPTPVALMDFRIE